MQSDSGIYASTHTSTLLTSSTISPTSAITNTINNRIPQTLSQFLTNDNAEDKEFVPKKIETPELNEVSASYTIIPSTSVIRPRTASGSDQGQTSASSIIIPPSSVMIPSKETYSTNENMDTLSEKEISIPTNVNSLSVSTISSNCTLTKTEIETPNQTSSLASKTRLRWDESKTKTTNEINVSEDAHINVQTPSVSFSKPVLDYSVRNNIRDKRSIFDIEMNTVNLTLAEKLRYEASKYAEFPVNQSKSIVTNAKCDDSENDPTSVRYHSVPSSPAHYNAERRPSWRLRIDAGNKVRGLVLIKNFTNESDQNSCCFL